jgi:hypothetical protein
MHSSKSTWDQCEVDHITIRMSDVELRSKFKFVVVHWRDDGCSEYNVRST